MLGTTAIAVGSNDGSTGPAPKVAFDGTNYLVTWTGFGLYAASVSIAGVVLDTPPKTLAADGSRPALAWDGSRYLLAWLQYPDFQNSSLFCNWLDPSVNWLDAQPTPIPAAGPLVERPAAVALGPGKNLVAYSIFDSSPALLASRVKFRIIDRVAGPNVDAGMRDAGMPDAGAPDAGASDRDFGHSKESRGSPLVARGSGHLRRSS